MLELRQVSKAFGNLTVLQSTDFSVPNGSTTVLIGPSGCGKSTLLRMIVGLIRADAGQILFQGTQLTQDNAEQLRLRMGYVIQDGGLFPHLSARDNIALLARHLKRDPAWVRQRIDELAALTRLPVSALDRFPSQISGGQRQRVGIMRALMLDPELILLDEPMGALDPLVRFDLQEDLRQIFRTLKKTVVMVTHDMGEAGFFGDEFVTRFIQAQRLATDFEPIAPK
jgi:osmoprotectant transport system ATP-binding protein